MSSLPKGWSGRNGRASLARRAAALLVGVPLIAGLAAPVAAAPVASAPTPAPVSPQAPPVPAEEFEAGRYIVMLTEEPVASYEGGVPGIPATSPGTGEDLDVDDPAVAEYTEHLEQEQSEVADASGVDIAERYTVALNGFAAELTAEQAQQLAKDPGVLALAEDAENHPTYTSTEFVGLAGEDGVWEQRFGGPEDAGAGVVVGVIDTGYLPESPYFAGDEPQPLTGAPQTGEPYLDAEGRIAMLKADGATFRGECEAGADPVADRFTGEECNSKVLSARYFPEVYTQYIPEDQRHPAEVLSPRDIDGHGSHTASTAVGNHGVEQVVAGTSFGEGSGMAPGAKLSVYKVCFADNDPLSGGCFTSSSVAAIEQAVIDGVDVLNYSISGNNTSVIDPVAISFLNASNAGVFVSTSAGNTGPGAATVNHSAPWLTTVAATTFPSDLLGTVRLSDGSMYTGSSVITESTGPAEAVLAEDVALAGAADANLCLSGTLDPARAAGAIVVCDRGKNARVEKSAEVERAGGAGMVLVNLADDTVTADIHAVPSVHLNVPGALKLREKVAAGELTAELLPGNLTGAKQPPVPQITTFSSRGPSTAVDSGLLKPDLAAPGQDVLAAVAPELNNGETMGFMSGTSMAAPHVAGYGALLLSANPAWSPAIVKSALMTSAGDVLNSDGSVNKDKFATGAGFAQPADAFAPGIAFDAGAEDWFGFLEGAGIDTGTDATPIETQNLNVPSIALGDLAGRTTITREVTAMEKGLYKPHVDIPGVKARFTPGVLNFHRPGETRTVRITLEADGAPAGEWAFGEISWKGPRTATLPVAVRPQEAILPDAVSGASEGPDGSVTIPVTSGTKQRMDVEVAGLDAGTGATGELIPGPLELTNDAHNVLVPVEVPEGAEYAWFEVNSADEAADFDLFVFTPDGQVLQLATLNASESGYLDDPQPGQYFVLANLFASPDGAATGYTVNAFAPAGDEGNLTVTPDPFKAPRGHTRELTATWRGLEPGSHMGEISVGVDAPASTMVRVEVTGGEQPVAINRELEGTDLAPQLTSPVASAPGSVPAV